jgi:hypothetical protein
MDYLVDYIETATRDTGSVVVIADSAESATLAAYDAATGQE